MGGFFREYKGVIVKSFLEPVSFGWAIEANISPLEGLKEVKSLNIFNIWQRGT